MALLVNTVGGEITIPGSAFSRSELMRNSNLTFLGDISLTDDINDRAELGFLASNLVGLTFLNGNTVNSSGSIVLSAVSKEIFNNYFGVAAPNSIGGFGTADKTNTYLFYDSNKNTLVYITKLSSTPVQQTMPNPLWLDGSSVGPAYRYYKVYSNSSISGSNIKVFVRDFTNNIYRWDAPGGSSYSCTVTYIRQYYENAYDPDADLNDFIVPIGKNPNSFKFLDVLFGENNYRIVSDGDESIYAPGGDTADPHNPYPSGSSPYTVDPLNSGEETDSSNTDGTWALPFDTVSDSPSTVHSVNLGLYNAYALSAAQVMELANYLFSGITEAGENLVKLIWGSKQDVVISLIEFPLMVTNQGVEEIRFIFDTALAGMFHGKQLTNEYLPIDFGTIDVPRYSGTFYDFEPYTTLTLYIPYIGYLDLKPTEVIGSTLSISGYVHLTTGEINVNVKSSRTGILGSYSGTIGRLLPIADADATEIYSAIIKTAASLGAVAVAGVGAASASSAAGAVSAPSHHAVDVAQSESQNAIKDWGTATKGIRGKQAEMMSKGVSYEAAVSSYNEQRSKYNQVNKAADNAREDFHDALSEAGSNAIGAVTTGFNVSRGTVMTSSNGRLSPQRCFLRIEVPHQNVSRNQKILGYPANSSDSLNSGRLHGYTELRTIELSIPRATLTEIQELENILRGGFYLP